MENTHLTTTGITALVFVTHTEAMANSWCLRSPQSIDSLSPFPTVCPVSKQEGKSLDLKKKSETLRKAKSKCFVWIPSYLGNSLFPP